MRLNQAKNATGTDPMAPASGVRQPWGDDPTPGDCCRLSLQELTTRFVHTRDPIVLDEVLSRPLFQWAGRNEVPIADFINLYAQELLDRGGQLQHIVEEARDLTLNRFMLLPETRTNGVDDCRTDCTHYYEAFNAACRKRIPDEASSLEREAISVSLLREHIQYHFRHSINESRRKSNAHIHRYTWNSGDHSVSLYMPRAMNGHEKRAWLEQNILVEDPQILEEPWRIQWIIDETLNGEAPKRYEAKLRAHMDHPIPSSPSLDVDHEFISSGIAATLAKEKVEIIDTLPPSVRELGKEKLDTLIHTVILGHANGGFNERSMAFDYGMAPASFSRFCGGHWTQGPEPDNGERRNVPLLWRNLASLLARSPLFTEAAKSAGVWDAVTSVIERNPTTQKGGCHE